MTSNTTVAVPTKSFWSSKLFWLGFVQFVIGVLEVIRTNVLESDTAAWGAVITGILTIILRLVTRQPVVWSTVQTPTIALKT